MKRIIAILTVIILLCGTRVSAAGSFVRIALIDSGIKADNSYIDRSRITEGKNYVFEKVGTEDLIGHGTSVAGIILEKTSKNVMLAPLVCFSKYPSGVPANSGVEGICRAIYDAVDVYDCQIINLSSGVDKESGILHDAVDYAEKMGVIVISAVGNDNQKAPERVFYPAAYETVVGVGSVNKQGEVSSFSQRNSSVMVTARGEDIQLLSQDDKETCTEVSGTSYAAAYVTAFAAMLLSTHPEMTPGEFRDIIRTSSQDLGDSGYDTSYGWGLIDLRSGLGIANEKITRE